MTDDGIEARIRDRVLSTHRDTIAAVIEAAEHVRDGVLRSSDGGDGIRIAETLETELRERDLDDPLLSLLRTGVDATGDELASNPVPAPPYLAVTSRGPVLRATLPEGRLVVSIRVFEFDREDRHYRRLERQPEAALDVEFR